MNPCLLAGSALPHLLHVRLPDGTRESWHGPNQNGHLDLYRPECFAQARTTLAEHLGAPTEAILEGCVFFLSGTDPDVWYLSAGQPVLEEGPGTWHASWILETPEADAAHALRTIIVSCATKKSS